MKRLAMVAMIVGGGAGCGGGADERATTATAGMRREAKVASGAIAERVLVTGQLAAASAVDLSVPKTDMWELTIRWMAEDGTLVKAGDKVLEFDNSSFTDGLQAKKLQVLEAESGLRVFRDLATMTSSVKEFELQAHRIALDKAKLMASVPPDLQPQRTAQERTLDKARMEAEVARAERSYTTEKQSSALESKVKQIDLDKAKRSIEAAEKSIDELVLKAPRDGVILVGTHPWMGKRFQIGDVVQPGFTIVTLPDLGQPLRVRAELSDVDDGKIAVGMKGTCTLDAYPREPIACSVLELAPVARANNRESLRRVFTVTLGLERSDAERMRPGMSVKIELPGAAAKATLTVPRGALVFDAKAPPRVRMGNGDLREVKLGACDALRCAVETGVTDGEVVLEGV